MVLTNHSNAGPGQIAYKIIDLFLGETVEETESTSTHFPGVNYTITSDLAGTYWSPELETSYQLNFQSGESIQGYHQRHGYFQMEMVGQDTLQGNLYAFRRAVLVRDEANQIVGLRVSNGRVRDLWFEKQ